MRIKPMQQQPAKLFLVIRICLVYLLISALVGCATVKRTGSLSQTYPSAEKVNLPVVLISGQELRQAAFEWYASSMRNPSMTKLVPWQDTFRIEMGLALAENAEAAARAVFREVTVTNSIDNKLLQNEGALLMPKLTNTNLRCSGLLLLTYTFSISVEWTLTTTNGQTIWVQEVSGNGESRPRDTKGVEQAILDSFMKAYHAMSSAPEIRAFVSNQVEMSNVVEWE
jgi:hypothetical protein